MPKVGLDVSEDQHKRNCMSLKSAILILTVSELVLLLIFYAPFILGRSNFFFADATFWLEPMARYLSNSILQEHRFPYWNSLNYCGMPQLAVTFPNLFYPFDYLFVLLPFSPALALSMVLHQTIAGAGTYALLRAFKQPVSSSICAATVYSLSGYMFALSANHSLVAGAAWCPWALWSMRSVESGSGRQRFHHLLAGTIFVYMLITSGRPEVFIPSILALLAYMCVSASGRKREGRRLFGEAFLFQVRILFLGFVLALPSILPTAEWLSRSRRAVGLESFEVFMYSASWYELASTIIGQALGNLRLHASEFRPLIISAKIPPYLSCAYVGAVAITLTFWGVTAKGWRLKYALLSVLILTLVASLGSNTAIMPLLVQAFPALGFVRFPVKLLFIAVLIVSILAARGLTASTNKEPVIMPGVVIWGAVLAWSIGCLAAGCANVHLLRFSGLIQDSGLTLKAQSLIGSWGIACAMLGLSTSAIGYLIKIEKLSACKGAATLIGLLAVSLITNAVMFEHEGGGSDYYSLPSFVNDRLQQFKDNGFNRDSRALGLYIELPTVPNFYLRGNQHEQTVATFQYDRQILLPDTNIDFSTPSSLGFEGAMKGDFYHEFLHTYLRSSQTLDPVVCPPTDLAITRFAQTTATGFIITQVFRNRKSGETVAIPLLDNKQFSLLLEDENMNVRIYGVLNAMPRCYLSHSWRILKSHNEALNAILLPEKNNFDPEVVTLLESSESDGKDHVDGTVYCASDSLKLKEISCEHLEIEVETSMPGLLVLADQPYPGWRAKIDAADSPILVANGFNRALHVPAGKHSITFTYVPDSFYLGVGLSALAVFLLAYLFWKSGRDGVQSS